MQMRSASSSSRLSGVTVDRDGGLTEFTGAILDAARTTWGDRFVTDANAKGAPNVLYTETHYALAAVLLFLRGNSDRALLDLAASRLRLWNDANGPMTFFNALAVCLTAIVFRRSGHEHAGLRSILAELLSRTSEHRHVAYTQDCGNNAYLQQVAVDTVVLPVAREEEVTREGLNHLIGEFQKYRTAEGFFYDLPRSGTSQEPLCPPTYIMKMLFLAGVCHELHPTEALASLFQSGMASVLPLLTRDGHFSYFGRTDNSPFAAGLTIFNLRQAARLCVEDRFEYDEACVGAEHHYKTFPSTTSGMLQSNRFRDATSASELNRSRDAYAYDGQYSLASCAYALLGCYWFPSSIELPVPIDSAREKRVSSVAISKDLGLVTLRGDHSELVLRTGCEATSWDRRYLGPTILRYQVDGQLLVGAISKTVSTDRTAQAPRQSTRAGRVYELFRDRFVQGVDQLDGTSVGFLPVLRRGTVDYLPYTKVAEEVSPSHLRTRYQMVQFQARGYRPCAMEALELLQNNLRVIGRKRYTRPSIRPVDSLELSREIYLEPDRCRIEDCVSGNVQGKTLLFSVRHLPGASIRLRGLTKVRSMTGWGSDGRQTIDVYEAAGGTSEIRYQCDIELTARPSL
jgi:hypothetical protein